MPLYEMEAGNTAVGVLIDEGKLVPDFWLRVKAQDTYRNTSEEHDVLKQQVADAVRFAMGKVGIEPPGWASPTADAPDYVWIYPEYRDRYPSTEPYYCPTDMYRAMRKCYAGDGLGYKDQEQLRRSYISVVRRSWRRLVPYFSSECAQDLLDIENERGNNGNTSSKDERISHMLSGAMFRDGAFYEFYNQQGEEGFGKILQGIGQKAILGVGAMLFMSGEHDELMPKAEALEELLRP